MPTASSDRDPSQGKFAAWQRWSPGALQPEAPAKSAPESAETIKRRAHATGFEEGKRAGQQAGYAEGRARAQAEAARIACVAQAADEALRALGDTLSRKTVALALAIARKVMQSELQTRPESILDVVSEALNLLPDSALRVRVVVNTEDAELVRAHLMAAANLPDSVVSGSNDVQRGGCLINAPCGDIDATLQTRFGRVLDVLGANAEPAP